jgi:hypothetical protein
MPCARASWLANQFMRFFPGNQGGLAMRTLPLADRVPVNDVKGCPATLANKLDRHRSTPVSIRSARVHREPNSQDTGIYSGNPCIFIGSIEEKQQAPRPFRPSIA